MQKISTLCVAAAVVVAVSGAGVDPGLPDVNPTTPGWYYDYTDTNNAQFQQYNSPNAISTLPKQDFVVIGGGWSGVSTAYHLAALQTTRKTVTLLEARGISDGASGRNLGWMAPKTFVHFNASINAVGLQNTLDQITFERGNANDIFALGVTAGLTQSEVTIGGRFLVYTTTVQSEFNQAYLDWQLYNRETNYADTFYIPKEICNIDFGISNAAGCFFISTHYHLRTPVLVWALFNKMVNAYTTTRVSTTIVNAYTRSPVTSVTSSVSGGVKTYTINVNGRFAVNASNVVFAANAWTSHLLPALQFGSTSSYQMFSAQQQVLQTNPINSQLILGFGAASVEWADDVYGLWQRPSSTLGKGGMIVAQGFGFLNSSDSQVDPGYQVSGPVDFTGNVGGGALTFVKTVFPKITSAYVDHLWTGVQGFTLDSQPFVGPLQSSSPQLFISAGFNGHGNPRAFGCGRNIAQQALGIAQIPALPAVYTTQGRSGFIAGALVGATFN